jgi:hypothetical protein
VVVPLLCLSGVVPCPTGENGTSNGRVLVNLDLTTAQPATGDALSQQLAGTPLHPAELCGCFTVCAKIRYD